MVTLEMLFWLIAILGIAGLGLKAFQLFFQKQKVLGVIEVVSDEAMRERIAELEVKRTEVFPDNLRGASYFG